MDHEPLHDLNAARAAAKPNGFDGTRFRDPAHQDAFYRYYQHVLDAAKDRKAGKDNCGCSDVSTPLCPEGQRLAEAAR